MTSISRVSHTKIIACGLLIVTIWFIFSVGHENANNFISKSEIITEKVVTLSRYTESEMKVIEKAKKCFHFNITNNNLNIQMLDDIMESEKRPKPGQSIFFHVTSCATNGRVTLNAR